MKVVGTLYNLRLLHYNLLIKDHVLCTILLVLTALSASSSLA
jgi:hypothetical protein